MREEVSENQDCTITCSLSTVLYSLHIHQEQSGLERGGLVSSALIKKLRSSGRGLDAVWLFWKRTKPGLEFRREIREWEGIHIYNMYFKKDKVKCEYLLKKWEKLGRCNPRYSEG